MLTYKVSEENRERVRVEGEPFWEATNLDKATTELVSACQFSIIDPNCECIELPFDASWNELIGSVEVRPRDGRQRVETCLLVFKFTKHFENWARPYSLKDYAAAVNAALQGSVERITYRANRLRGSLAVSGFSLVCRARSSENVISDEIGHWQEIVKSICSSAEKHLLKSIQKNSLVTFFDFPLEIRKSCEQYLIYFLQFLEDLGIESDSEIKEEAGRVLFSITPRDGPSALGRIRKALDVYLQLPRNREFSSVAEQFPDIAVVQLKSNVLFLQSQLELAKATIQAKDAAIQALDFIVFQQRQFLTESADGSSSSKMDQEAIVGDTVHVIPLEGKGFRINLPKILRRLKRAFGTSQPGPAILPPGPDEE